MEFTVPTSDLFASLDRVTKVIQSNPSIPLLHNVYMHTANNQLSLRATDMDVSVETRIAADVKTDGTITAPGKILKGIAERLLKANNDGSTSFALDKTMLAVHSGRSRYKLHTIPADDFPQISAPQTNCGFDLPAKDGRQLFKRPQFVIPKDDKRPYLQGIFLHSYINEQQTSGLLRAVTTDGHILARVDAPLPMGAGEFSSRDSRTGIIVPDETIQRICDIFLSKSQDVSSDILHLQLTDTKIAVGNAHTTLVSKLLDGTYPDYPQVVPVNNDKVMRADRVVLLDALKRLFVLSDSRKVMKSIKLSIRHNALTLTGNVQDNGMAEDDLDVDWDSGDLDIGFNIMYLISILDEMNGIDIVEIRLSDARTAALIQGVGDLNAIFVLMPMELWGYG